MTTFMAHHHCKKENMDAHCTMHLKKKTAKRSVAKMDSGALSLGGIWGVFQLHSFLLVLDPRYISLS